MRADEAEGLAANLGVHRDPASSDRDRAKAGSRNLTIAEDLGIDAVIDVPCHDADNPVAHERNCLLSGYRNRRNRNDHSDGRNIKETVLDRIANASLGIR
jgi:hypothetical protein